MTAYRADEYLGTIISCNALKNEKKKWNVREKKDDFLTVEAIYSENMNTSEIQRLELRML